MMACAAKVWGSSKQYQRNIRKVVTPSAMNTPSIPLPLPAIMPSNERPEITEKETTPVSYPTVNIPSGSGSGMPSTTRWYPASEEGRQAAMVEAQRYLRCLDTKTVQSLRRHEERECLKREKKLLQDENRLLKETVQNLEAQEGPSFEDRYFTACYEMAIALPPPFDLQTALNWDREQIMAKAA
ncbi:hypothetical protein LWI28_023301 [Acer negundo]|uniref:Uncharacterized protein n=1 Tax=Acer negundo TaxID=4023 RepID=A0AAD5NYY6_ACENE|nr:hypothetical protein LWI28_023301 [Acer negundo]